MALRFAVTLRNDMLQRIQIALDVGAGAALFRIYDGTQPATGGTATVLLAELVCTDPVAGAAATGVLTFSTINQDTSANATGTATWFRMVDSAATFVMDGTVTATGGGGDLQLTSTAITITQPVSISSATITAGNA